MPPPQLRPHLFAKSLALEFGADLYSAWQIETSTNLVVWEEAAGDAVQLISRPPASHVLSAIEPHRFLRLRQVR